MDEIHSIFFFFSFLSNLERTTFYFM
jgi:hypothetical protein